MIIAVDGPAASGKGTIARALARRYGAWLRTDEVGAVASIVSAHPLVRLALLHRQKRFAHQPGGAVLDGRDIGTVIAPDAQVKLFVKATPMIRAQRRHLELRKSGILTSLDKVLSDIRARDDRDARRSEAPMTQAADAALLDTSFLSIDAAVQRAIALVEAAKARAATS
ncbi:MAG: (d)CMP kinase [Sphingomonadales bacterium]|nr:MAG: (d)CMP kinase [Sphingomonadales bacterium]